MAYLSIIKNLQWLGLKQATPYQKQWKLKTLQPQSVDGFTLIEMMVVVFIIGILSAIAAPSWLGFTNGQRIRTANDAVFRAIQTAQSEAKRTKKDYSVSFQNSSSLVPQFQIYEGNSAPSTSGWRPLAENQNFGQVQFSSSSSSSTSAKVTFDYLGTVQQSIPDGTPLTVTVELPSTNVKRCVKIETILGAMRVDKTCP